MQSWTRYEFNSQVGIIHELFKENQLESDAKSILYLNYKLTWLRYFSLGIGVNWS